MNELAELKAEVCRTNRDLPGLGLVTLTWGNVSGLTRDRAMMVIKPSGVPYSDLTPELMCVLDRAGEVVEGTLRPSTDAPTHLALYRNWSMIGGITHTHSAHATMFAQARREIPCFGTTHADHFRGTVPVTRAMANDEAGTNYEENTGRVIVERFASLDPAAIPGVLLAGHGPFTWGSSAAESLENAVALEAIAKIAFGTIALGGTMELEPHLLERHHGRKHGHDAYYGQV